jgi:TolB-like protein
MKKIFFLTYMMVFAWIGNTQAQDKMIIAVMDFKAGAGVAQSEVTGISAILTTYLNDTKKFTIVERTQIDEVLNEQGFQYSSLTNRQMIKLGEILNAQKLVVGDVNIVGGQYNIDARILDVETGNMDSGAGEMWVKGTSYREVMKKVAQTLVSKMNFPISQFTPPAAANPNKGKVVTLYKYLHVYPDDLGSFPSVPNTVINAINSDASYGYNDWRVPTTEEMALIKANRSKIFGLASGDYMTSDGTRSGNVRLVTTGKTVAEKDAETAERREAERRAAELRKSLPPHAASTQTWTFGEQTWSDAIQIPACHKTSFINSKYDPQCRSYTDGSTIWFYYNWAYVNKRSAQLCPAPWRVPARADFDLLESAVPADLLVQTWGLGGELYEKALPDPYADANYWASDAASEESGRRCGFTADGRYSQWRNSKIFGRQVRCVK